MAVNISDLPPKYQVQAVKKYMEQQARGGGGGAPPGGGGAPPGGK